MAEYSILPFMGIHTGVLEQISKTCDDLMTELDCSDSDKDVLWENIRVDFYKYIGSSRNSDVTKVLIEEMLWTMQDSITEAFGKEFFDVVAVVDKEVYHNSGFIINGKDYNEYGDLEGTLQNLRKAATQYFQDTQLWTNDQLEILVGMYGSDEFTIDNIDEVINELTVTQLVTLMKEAGIDPKGYDSYTEYTYAADAAEKCAALYANEEFTFYNLGDSGVDVTVCKNEHYVARGESFEEFNKRWVERNISSEIMAATEACYGNDENAEYMTFDEYVSQYGYASGILPESKEDFANGNIWSDNFLHVTVSKDGNVLGEVWASASGKMLTDIDNEVSALRMSEVFEDICGGSAHIDADRGIISLSKDNDRLGQKYASEKMPTLSEYIQSEKDKNALYTLQHNGVTYGVDQKAAREIMGVVFWANEVKEAETPAEKEFATKNLNYIVEQCSKLGIPEWVTTAAQQFAQKNSMYSYDHKDFFKDPSVNHKDFFKDAYVNQKEKSTKQVERD